MLTNNAPDDALGGLERYVGELSENLVGSGLRVSVVAKRRSWQHPADEVDGNGTRVIRYPVPPKSDPLFALKYPSAVARGVRAALTRLGPYDVVHAHFPVPVLSPALTGRVKYVYTMHGPVWRELLQERQGSYFLPTPVQRVARTGLRQAERRAVAGASQILTLSEYMRGEVSNLSREAASRTRVLPGGVDLSMFVPPPPRDSIRRSHRGPTLFTARRLAPGKGVLELVQSMPQVLRHFPELRLEIAGDGVQLDVIARTIRSLKLGAHVRMLGQLNGAELVGCYQRADLAITPTQDFEPFGLSTVEAMACGTPCLVTPVGGSPEIVRGLSVNLVAPDTTSDGLAAAIIGVLSEGRLGSDLSTECRERMEIYSWSNVARLHVQIYEAFASQTQI